jgi:hypothetical protein
LSFAYYNLCKVHGAIRCTPAMKRASKAANGRLRNWLNGAVNKQDYLARLQVAASQLHNCGAVWRSTAPFTRFSTVKPYGTVDVEVFDLHNHPEAKRAYARSHRDGKQDERERFVAALEIPHVDSAQKAVQVQIVKDFKKGEL